MAISKPKTQKPVTFKRSPRSVFFQEEAATNTPTPATSIYDSSESTSSVRSGTVIEGKVASIQSDKVLIDLGFKAEGQVPLDQFTDETGKADVEVGETFLFYVERVSQDGAMIQLSRNKAEEMKAWEEIAEACRAGTVIEGVVRSAVRGGFEVDIGVLAFVPSSQIDARPSDNPESYVGQTLKFRVLKFNRKRNNIVLSRKAIIDEERSKMREHTMKELEVGAVVRGIVKNLTDYGAFIDIGGVDGLLHITDMGWGRIKHPSDVLKVGQEIQVRVLKFDREKGRVSLGLKQTQEDPWKTVFDRFRTGIKVQGKVLNVTDYGAFVEVEPGIEGLIHVSEMSWTQKVKDPRAILQPEQTVEAVILDIDANARRMSLGLKQAQPNPWDNLQDRYPLGSKITGVVKNVTDFGIFVGVEEGIDGLVHVSDMSWDQKVTNPHEKFNKGDTVEAIVSAIDRDNERFSLSIRALTQDPMDAFLSKHPIGTQMDVKVTRLANFGAFVELAEGIEGMIHVSELSTERIPHPEAVVKVGDTIKAEIINVDNRDRKVSLSVKAMHLREEKQNLEAYKAKEGAQWKTSLGSLLDAETQKRLDSIVEKK